jgi:hypothetical protein
MSTLLLLVRLVSVVVTQVPSPDPPSVNEEALARRLFEMAAPTSGERAVIVFDPTYYPGITARLREALHAASVDTFLVVEDTPSMIERYVHDPNLGKRREEAIVSMLTPLFKAADIFYCIPWNADAQRRPDVGCHALTHQSVRSATSGSTVVARQAGPKHASVPATRNAIPTIASATGSVGLV